MLQASDLCPFIVKLRSDDIHDAIKTNIVVSFFLLNALVSFLFYTVTTYVQWYMHTEKKIKEIHPPKFPRRY
jgi:hypothetical protein